MPRTSHEARRTMRYWLIPLTLLAPTAAFAQEPAFREDLRFAEALRARGDVDLALEVLKRLEAGATPELKKELPLEFAKTRLRLASDEPDISKRLNLYREARTNFEQFIASNAGHPRVPEANLDIARVLNAIGKTEWGRALLAEDAAGRKAQAAQARATLVAAQARLVVAEKELTALREKLPDYETETDPKKKKFLRQAHANAEAAVRNTAFERAMNLYDQAETFLDDDVSASPLLVEARDKVLGPLAAGPVTSPITWKAKAWQGRIIFQTDTADKARAKFREVAGAGTAAAAEGQRLARYFVLSVIEKNPEPAEKKDVPSVIRTRAEAWRRDYPRFLKTPEGYGVTYMLARYCLAEAANPKLAAATRTGWSVRARSLLRELEAGENEYTERARRDKIRAIDAEGGFKRKVSELKTFEDLYIRAQYEVFQMSQDPAEAAKAKLKGLPDPATITDPKMKKGAEAAIAAVEKEIAALKDPKEAEKRRKGHVDAIKDSLKRALAAPDAKKVKGTAEHNNARAMLTYWALNTGALEDAIMVGEEFIRDDPRSSQAGITAIYTLQAYAQLVDQKRAKFADDLPAWKTKLNAAAAYVEQRWPSDNPGEMARHTLALQMVRDENYPEAIKKLELIAPTYASYPLVCFQISDAADKAIKGGDKDAEGYRARSLQALERCPMTALGADPFTNQITVAAKAKLGRELFRTKKYSQMQTITAALLPKLNGLKFNDEDEKDKAIRNQLRAELTDVALYAAYGLGTAAFEAKDNKTAAAIMDPLVDTLSKKEDSPEKASLQKNQQLARAILTTALRANLNLGKADRAELVLQSLDEVMGEGGGGANILQLLAQLVRVQVEEVRKTGNKEALKKAVEDYTRLLKKRTEKLPRTPELVRALAGCYMGMEDYQAAARELAELNKGKVNEKDPSSKASRLMYIRALRLSKVPGNMKEARRLIDEALAPDGKKAGWGMRDLGARKENGLLLQDEGKYGQAFDVWVGLVKLLAPQIKVSDALREAYLEVYYYMVYSVYKAGMGKPAQKDRDKAVEQTATQIRKFEGDWPEFGGGASQKRFTELLAAEPVLNAQYLKLKATKGPKK